MARSTQLLVCTRHYTRRHGADEVEQQDHQDREAPDPVQHRQVSMQVGPWVGIAGTGSCIAGSTPARLSL